MVKYILLIIILIFTIYYNYKDNYFNDKVLTLGVSIPKSGIMKAWGNAVYSGASAHFLEVNKNNLLKNKKIKLIVYDDKYEPELTIENTKKLIKEEVFAFFGFVGTPTVKKILPLLESNDIPFIAPFTGAPFLRKSNRKNYVNFRSSYQEEISYMVKYLHKNKNITKFAVFYQNDDYGEVGFVSLLHALDNEGLTLAGEGAYKRNTLSIRHAFYEIKSVKPEAVLMVGAYKANALFIKTAKSNPIFKDTIFCNISFGDADEMIKELNYETKNLLFSQVVPDYNDDSKGIILEYKKMMKKYYPKQELGFVSLEAYLAAKTITMALNNIKGNVSRDKFLKEIKNLPKNSLDGIIIDYKNSELHNEVYLFEYKNSKFVEVKQ